MTASELLKEINGIIRSVVADSQGRVFERSDPQHDAESLVAAGNYIGSQFETASQLLGLGRMSAVLVAPSPTCLVFSYKSGHLLVAECNNARAASLAEAALTTSDWTTLIESPIDDSELEYVPSSRTPNQQSRQKPAKPPIGKGETTTRAEPPAKKSERPGRLNPPPKITNTKPQFVKSPIGQSPSPSSLQEAGALASSVALLGDLRRALAKGQLKQAEMLAARLIEDAATRNTVTDAAPLPTGLREGISMVLAGDALGGLAKLREVEQSTQSPSIRWATLLWCARASAGAGNGLSVANGFVQKALAIAAQLDTEARALATYEHAFIMFHQGEAGEALELTHTARSLFASTTDPHLLASCWLLEARVLGKIGSHEESVNAAKQAREKRPSWPPPTSFIARRALSEGRFSDAQRVLAPLVSKEPMAPEIRRFSNIVEYVRNGTLPVEIASEFLEIVDSTPTDANTQRLEEISDTYPKIEYFHDVLGWQLLRTGRYESAAVVFEWLGARSDISADVRASVLLGLGCLAARRSRSAKPGAKARATVDAAPKNFKSAKPTPPSSGKLRVAVPLDFRISDIPPAAPNADGRDVQLPTTTDLQAVGPVFSGSMQLFGLPDLLEFLRSGQRTGTLVCSSSAGIGAIQIRRGYVTSAASPNTRGLRDYLVAMGIVNTTTLDEVELGNHEDQALIGAALVKKGITTADQIRIALRDQVQDAIKELMNWGVGQFAFNPEAASEVVPPEIDVEFDPQDILLSIFKEMDERSSQRP